MGERVQSLPLDAPVTRDDDSAVVDWKGFQMSVHFTRGGFAAFILAFSSQSALADLTAQDVWSDWQAYIAGMGYEVTGTETMSGDTLKITDFGYVVSVPEEGVDVTITASEMSLTENSDGTVSISVPPSQTITMDVTVEDDENAKIDLDYSQIGLAMIVSGDPGHMTYEYSADSLTVSLASVEVDGEKMAADVAQASMILRDIAGSSEIKVTDMRSTVSNMNVGSMNFDVVANNPDGDDTFSISGRSENLSSDSNFIMPLVINTSDVRAMLDAGSHFDGSFSFGAGGYDVKGSSSDGKFSANGSSQGGAFEIEFNSAKLLYGFSVNTVKMAITSDQLPFPVSFDFAKYGIKLDIPMANTMDIQDFALALTLQDFSMIDALWSLFDPAGSLPRDPASINLDVKGKARILVDILDPDVEEKVMSLGKPPAELHALTINDLLVAAVGAKLTGSGDFTFNNNDLATYGGFPAPAGKLALKLIGVNGLIDRLVGMGLIGDNEVMGARMGMGMLTVPGDGDDTLISDIEMTADGHIVANGQRIK